LPRIGKTTFAESGPSALHVYLSTFSTRLSDPSEKSLKFVSAHLCSEVLSQSDSTTKVQNVRDWHGRLHVDGSSEVGMFGAEWDGLGEGGEACS